MDYKELANSKIVLVLVVISLVLVLIQAISFIYLAWKRGREIGMKKDTLKSAATNAALTSIVPSLPIIVSMLALSVPLGRYFSWYRNSVVGSAVYEGIAANVAAQALGLEDISDPNLTADLFVIIMFIMTVGIIWGIVFNIFILPIMDKKAKQLKSSKSGSKAMSVISGALFVAMLSTLSVPYFANVKNIPAMVAFFSAGLTVLLLNWISKKTNKSIFSDFALPIAMLVGMAFVILIS